MKSRVILMLLALITALGFTNSAAIQAQDDIAELTPDFEVKLEWLMRGVQWKADGSQFLIYGDDPFVRVYDVAAQQQLFTLQQLSLERESSAQSYGSITFAEWSPDEAYILTVGSNYHIKLWDAATGDYLRGWPWPTTGDIFSPIVPLWHPDSQHIVVYQNGIQDVYVWDVTTGENVLTLSHSGFVTHASFSPDHTRLLVQTVPYVSENFAAQVAALSPEFEADSIEDIEQVLDQWDVPVSVYVWDIVTGELLLELPHPEMEVHVGQWSADGATIFTSAGVDTNYPAKVLLAEVFAVGLNDQPEPDWGELLSAFGGHSALRLWDSTTGALIWENRGLSTANFARVSGDESRILTITFDSQFEIYERATGKLVYTLPLADPIAPVEVTGNDTMTQLHILEQGPSGCGLSEPCTYYWRIVDVASDDVILERDYTGPYANTRDWSPDLTHVAWRYGTGSSCFGDCIYAVLIMDPQGNTLARLPHSGQVHLIEWNAAGDRLVTMDIMGYVRLWTINDQQIQ